MWIGRRFGQCTGRNNILNSSASVSNPYPLETMQRVGIISHPSNFNLVKGVLLKLHHVVYI